MSARLRSLIAQIGSFALAAVLLYLALRGVDLAVVGQAIRGADYRWLAPLIGVVVISHVLRAWRWQMLLDVLPHDATEPRPQRVDLRLAFSSVMIGYMVNYAAPRLGEVARTANVAARARHRFSAVFGTVVIERVLDMAVLLLALGSVFFILLDRSATLDELFIAPLRDQLGRIPALALAGIAVGTVVLVLLVYRQTLRNESSRLYALWNGRLRPMLVSFRDGLFTLQRSGRPAGLVVSTVLMWACYLLMAYIPFRMLGMAGAYDLTLVDAWAIMSLGAIGVALPSPGGVGSYHYITIQTLVYLFAVDAEPAATYAVLSHAAQLILYVLLGAGCLLLQGSSLRALRAQTAAATDGGETRA